MQDNVDRAGEKYWTGVWENTALPQPINIHDLSFKNFTNTEFHKFFDKLFINQDLKDKSILEIGCGNSVWLPYFAKQYGLKAFGIDYSELGCENSRKILERDGIDGIIYCADAFVPSTDLIEKFDIVISMGVIEHFENLNHTISSFSKYVKKGGLLISTLPNNNGLLGWFQKKLNKPIFDIHYIYDVSNIENAYNQNHLSVIKSAYLVPINLYVNLEPKNGKLPSGLKFKKIINKFLSLINLVVWLVDSSISRVKRTKKYSSAIAVVGLK
ncbi:MAG TPA: class I SAM-dependent methyltransferase [Bacteroidia bacterium]|nr:class I SAM-dependent methyltransferase [Bacteroidia bacterium]HNT80381.1 class I SAM-dependent methyltransferase [Bacteroidia bacterium]